LRFFMPGTAARMPWNAADRLMAMIASHFSIGKSSIGETNWMPALLTRMSTAAEILLDASAIISGDLGGLGHVGRRIRGASRRILFRFRRAMLLDRIRRIAESVDNDICARSPPSCARIARPMPLVEPVIDEPSFL
jgi:hypothetical protein